MLRVIFLFFVFCNFVFASAIDPNLAFKLNPKIKSSDIIFNFDVDFKTYVYKDKIKIQVKNLDTLNSFAKFPLPIRHSDIDVYSGDFNISLPLGVIYANGLNVNNFDIFVEFYGCSNDGYCYPPQQRGFKFTKSKDGIYNISNIDSKEFFKNNSKNSEIQTQNSQNQKLSVDEKIANLLKNGNFLISILTFFGYGILLSLTPCVLPMVPILSSIIALKTKEKKYSSFFVSFVYVFSMALAYAFVGICAGFLGSSIQTLLQTPFVIVIFSLIFVILAFSMFGFYEIKAPNFIQNYLNKKSGKKDGLLGVFIMGFFSALIVGPCVAPPLAGALLYIAKSNDVFLGGICLFMLGFGSGLPLLLLGAGYKAIKAGEWMVNIQKVFAFVLLFMAAWMFSRITGENFALLMYAFLGVIFCFYFGLFENGHKVKRGILAFIFIYCIILMLGFANGSNSFLKPLQNSFLYLQKYKSSKLEFKNISTLDELKNELKNSTKPVMIEFSAGWCTNCKELENITFKDSRVIKALNDFNLLKIDLSKNDKNDILSYFSLFGPPALIFYKNNQEIKKERVIGFISPSDLLEKLKEI